MKEALIFLILSGKHPCMEMFHGRVVKEIRHSTTFAEVAYWDAEKKAWMEDYIIHPMVLFSEPWVRVRCPDETR